MDNFSAKSRAGKAPGEIGVLGSDFKVCAARPTYIVLAAGPVKDDPAIALSGVAILWKSGDTIPAVLHHVSGHYACGL